MPREVLFVVFVVLSVLFIATAVAGAVLEWRRAHREAFSFECIAGEHGSGCAGCGCACHDRGLVS